GVRFHSDDWVFMRYREPEAIADISERKCYLRTNLAETRPDLGPIFARSKCENVTTKREDCTNRTCPERDNCPLQKDGQYCLLGFHNSRAIVDPNWFAGPDKYVRRTRIKHVVIVKRDPVSPVFEDLETEPAVKLLETGRYQITTPGATGYGSFRNQPFYNPYLLVQSRERMELQKNYYRRLFSVAKPYAINTGVESVEKCIARLMRVIAGKKE
ncbi:MAG: hypothetical protein KJ645_11010, partial [Planctomycetes bacterium]|nr:hypothetical protein [Planctomycetota bacterium]